MKLSSNVVSVFTGEDPGPQPDPEYISYINKINGNQANGFYWKNISQVNYSGYPYYRNSTILRYPVKDYTWYAQPSNPDTYSTTFSNYSFNCSYIQCSDVQTLYINEDNGLYIGTITNISGSYSTVINDNGNCATMRPVYNSIDSFKAINGNPATYLISAGKVLTYSSSSLADCLNYYANRFRNINIYVNGKCWALAGQDD